MIRSFHKLAYRVSSWLTRSAYSTLFTFHPSALSCQPITRLRLSLTHTHTHTLCQHYVDPECTELTEGCSPRRFLTLHTHTRTHTNHIAKYILHTHITKMSSRTHTKPLPLALNKEHLLVNLLCIKKIIILPLVSCQMNTAMTWCVCVCVCHRE